ncbi:glycerophosphodiester phosphodiesterase family protein [Chitinophaga arvensicola]|uniref:Glycerophosphoryl diester phosphodiesterase n=1 Tax=Chitinophaga arvensicola TaxID=29529 RepID=A0A1I0RUV5_9BACT|nr:glycerophosphodiester phosphodiesterase family protein [Chitinophaga arvensicola]SEW45169.1 glycerophosphoryl diester phosphodiesterase [Chitinophaga arvensicola]
MKRYFFIALILGGTWASVQAQTTKSSKANVDLILKDFHQRPDRILVAAHRSAHTNYPENSLAAISEAIKQGIDIAEIDLRLTKDSILVLMHDKTITRTTGQKGEVSSFTYEELKQFPLLHNGKPTAERIPTFKEALLLAKGKIIIDVDFKADGQEAARKAYALINSTGTTKQILFFIYDYQDATFLQSISKQVPIMPRAHDAAETAAILGIGKFPAIHVDPSFYTEKLMTDILKAGSRVWINALDEIDNMEKANENTGFDLLFSKYPQANIIQTDLPEKLLRYLRKKGRHQ